MWKSWYGEERLWWYVSAFKSLGFMLLVCAAGSCSWFVQLVRASHFIRGLVKTVQREFRKALHEIHRPRAPSEVSPFSASSGCMVCRVGLNRVWPYVR